MKLSISAKSATVGVLRIDGKRFCFITGYDVLCPESTYSVILRSTMGDLAPFIVGIGAEITDTEGQGLQIGSIAGDDFVLDGRATLARLINLMRDAVDALEKITLEIE